MFKTYVNLHVNEIIETPEAIQPRVNNYLWSDNSDFGYIYINENMLNLALIDLSESIHEKILNDEQYGEYYQKVIDTFGIDIPDLADSALISQDYASKYCNQILIEKEDGYTEEQVLDNVTDFLESKGVDIKESSISSNLFYIIYIKNCIKQLTVASLFLPIFFYCVTMIVIGLFMSQIITAMTRDIGVMMSIGVGFKDIQSIFLLFSLLMSIAAGIIGVTGGYFLNRMLSDTMINVYSIPTIPHSISVLFAIISILILAVFSLITTMLSCRSILRITPKDATISNESKRKPIPKKIDDVIEKAPMNVKLWLNSVFQNPRRFLVSTFAIFASFIIIILSLFFSISKEEMINQSVDRRMKYDCQVYFSGPIEDEDYNNIKSLDSVTSSENCLYTYVEAKSDKGSVFLECLAFDSNSDTELINIPSKNGKGSLKIDNEGIIIPKSSADTLKVKVGDTITINDKKIKISAISNQYFHPITYMTKDKLKSVTSTYVSSIILNTNDENAFLSYLEDNYIGSLPVFTRYLGKDIHDIFNSINIFIIIMVLFSMLMGFVILSIMSQNALMEQKRQVTIFRAIGFRMMNISNLWTLLSVSHLISSSIFAIPAGILCASILFKLCSSQSQTYPLIASPLMILLALGFILIIIIISHSLSMLTVRRWNIADNTRSRE